jgi:hypothetical protein
MGGEYLSEFGDISSGTDESFLEAVALTDLQTDVFFRLVKGGVALLGEKGGNSALLGGTGWYSGTEAGEDAIDAAFGDLDALTVRFRRIQRFPIDKVDDRIDAAEIFPVVQNALTGRIAAVDIFPEFYVRPD